MIWRSWSVEKSQRVRGLFRVMTYFSVITVACGIVSVRHARAEYENRTLAFGRQMIELAKASSHELTTINFNGQPIHVGSSLTPDLPDQILDRYKELCTTNRAQTELGNVAALIAGEAGASVAPPEDVVQHLADLPTTAEPELPELAKSGALRMGDGEEGAVLCFVRGSKSKSNWAEALAGFYSTGDLGALGELRYAYAKRGQNGTTHVLTAWTDSAFNFLDMMGDEGKDCAGEDFPELPRLPNTTRIVSARAEGTPFGVNVYKTKESPTKALAFYDEQMKAAGWFTYDPEMTEAEHKGLGRAYLKDAVVVTLGTSVESDGTYVAVGLAGVSSNDAGEGGPRLGRAR